MKEKSNVSTSTHEDEEADDELIRNRFLKGVHALYDEVQNDPEHDPENHEVVEALHKVRKAIKKAYKEKQGITLEDDIEKISDIYSNDPAPNDQIDFESIQNLIQKVVNDLPERERNIICLRYGLTFNYATSLEEVGRMFKATRERILEIEAKALKKMKHPERIRKMDKFFREPLKEKPQVLKDLGL